MAISINHDMDQGSNFRFSVVAKDANGDPKDISSGYTAYSQMRKFYTSNTAINLVASITGSTGEVRVSLGPTGTSAIKAGTWFYDVELHSGGSTTVERLVQGMIYVHPETTKSP